MIKEKIKITELEHLKIEFTNQEYTAILIDSEGFEMLKGYGISVINAINDLHKNLT